MEDIFLPKGHKEPYQIFMETIEDRGLIKIRIADKLGFTSGHFSNILNGTKPLTEDVRKRLNDILNTNI